jgi:hypothetical protein
MNRNEAIRRIKAGLKTRTGKTWSVTGGRGTAWGWIKIGVPPKRQDDYGCIPAPARQELATALSLPRPVHQQGVNIPASNDYYQEYVDRAEGRCPSVIGRPYWD